MKEIQCNAGIIKSQKLLCMQLNFPYILSKKLNKPLTHCFSFKNKALYYIK